MKNRFTKWCKHLTLTNSHSRHGTCKNGGFERDISFSFRMVVSWQVQATHLFQGMQVVSRLDYHDEWSPTSKVTLKKRVRGWEAA